MADIHDAKRIVETLLTAMESEDGADIGNGVSLFLSKQFSLVVTKTENYLEVAFAPPPDVYAKRAFGLLNLHGTLEKIVVTTDSMTVMLDGLPDQKLRIVS